MIAQRFFWHNNAADISELSIAQFYTTLEEAAENIKATQKK